MRVCVLVLSMACVAEPGDEEATHLGVAGAGCADAGIAAVSAGRGFELVQHAIDQASDGGSVSVCDGVHTERLWITSSLTLRAAPDAHPVIDAAGAGRVVTAHAARVELLDLELRRGRAEYGGNAHIVADEIIVERCTLRGGRADLEHPDIDSSGGGLSLVGDALLRDTLFVDNQALHTGGGLFASGPSEGWRLVVEGCGFEGNLAGREGGGAHVSSAEASFVTTTFSGNRSATSGGGLAANGLGEVSLRMEDVELTDNSATHSGGGLHMAGARGMDLTLTRTLVARNQAVRGAGVFAQAEQSASISLDQVHVNDNIGGGAHLWATEPVRVVSSHFMGHETGVALDTSLATVLGGSIVSNRVGLQIDEAGQASLEGVDLGTDSSDNQHDIIYGLKAFQADGVADVECRDGTCARIQ